MVRPTKKNPPKTVVPNKQENVKNPSHVLVRWKNSFTTVLIKLSDIVRVQEIKSRDGVTITFSDKTSMTANTTMDALLSYFEESYVDLSEDGDYDGNDIPFLQD